MTEARSEDHESSNPLSSAEPPPTGPASTDCTPVAAGAASHPAAGSVVASHWASPAAVATSGGGGRPTVATTGRVYGYGGSILAWLGLGLGLGSGLR